MATAGVPSDQWAVNIMGLDQVTAEEVTDFVGRELRLQAEPLDPTLFMVMYMDHETVLAIRRGISSDLELQDVVAAIDEWLAQSDPTES
jgi:hypothetical protein